MKTDLETSCFGNVARFLVTAFLCLASTSLIAQSDSITGSVFAQGTYPPTLENDANNEGFSPFPLVREDAGLAFNLAGSDQRKLQLQLTEPLSLNLGAEAGWLDSGSNALSAGASLDWLMPGGVRLSGGIDEMHQNIQFQPIGSIRCENGILEAGSFRASDCYFLNGSNSTLNQQRISFGASTELPGGITSSVSMFRNETDLNNAGVRQLGSAGGSSLLHAGLLTPSVTNPLLPEASLGEPLEYLQSDATGIDVDFQLGFTTDNSGDVMLGLQLTRVLDAEYNSAGVGISDPLGWRLAEPVDTAQLNFDWRKGSFSGGIQSFYREPVEFLDRAGLDSMTTFDVHFTWRTPWNASLSVGASNVLNAGVDEPGNGESPSSDPFESVYGRIPYVRYKQDL